MNRALKFTWDEWKWLAIIVMLGVVMYWTALVIEPTYTILREAEETQKAIESAVEQSIEQNHILIENQNNNTKVLQTLITGQAALKENQVVLVRELGNATQDLGSKSADIETNSKVLVLQSAAIQNILDWAAKNFSEADKFNRNWEKEDRMRSHSILGNISDMAQTLRILELLADRPNQIGGAATVNRTVNVTN